MGWLLRLNRLRFDVALALLLTRSSTDVCLLCIGALEMLEGLFAIDATRTAHRTKRFDKTALHGSVYVQSRKVSVFNIMKVIRYETVVDPDVNYDPKKFGTEVDIYLADPNGWAQKYDFVRGGGKTIRLCTPKTIGKVGCGDEKLSCATVGGVDIWLNSDRWMNGATASKLPLVEYRQYMISHEMGHSLGHDHIKNPGYGPAPIMIQQTLGIGKCTPNTHLTEFDLNR